MAKFTLSAFTDEYSPNFDKQIEGMLQNGIKYTELRGVDGKNVADLTSNEAKAVKEKLDANGLAVWSVGSPLGKIKLTDDINRHMDQVKRVCETANILDTKNIRVFSFYIPSTENIAPYRNQVMEYLSIMLETSKPYGVVLCHENEKGIYGAKTEGCLDIMKTFKSGYKCIFDPANFLQEGVVTYPDAYDKLKDYIYYMHIKDCRANGSIAPAGMGEGKIPEILTDLNKRDGELVLTVEPHLRVFSGLAALEENGNTTDIIDQYATSEEAFNAACNAIKAVVAKIK